MQNIITHFKKLNTTTQKYIFCKTSTTRCQQSDIFLKHIYLGPLPETNIATARVTLRQNVRTRGAKPLETARQGMISRVFFSWQFVYIFVTDLECAA